MPIVWTYLLRSYFRVFLLSLSGFVSILLVTRLKEIARFAALASKGYKTLAFTAYQIPHILPIAIPISCLISSILLMQQMSRTGELTAFRASGLPLKALLSPLLITASFLSFTAFYISSEITTYSKQRSREMLVEETTLNPLILLQRQKLLKIDNCYVDMRVDDRGKMAKEALFLTKGQSEGRLSLMSAKKFFLEKETLRGESVTLISHAASAADNTFDMLMLENQKELLTHAPSISQFMKKNPLRLNSSSLPLRALLLRTKEQVKRGENAFKQYTSLGKEILRRSSLGFGALSFTFIGGVLGMELGRSRSQKKMVLALFLAVLFFALYMVGKQLKENALLASLVFILPHLLLYIVGMRYLRRFSRGIGS